MQGKELSNIEGLPRAFLDKLVVGLSLVDIADGRIIFANAECARIFGYSQQELNDGEVTFIDLTYPEDRDRNLAEHRRLLNGEVEEYRLRKRYLRRDGSLIWAKIAVSGLRDGSGALRWSCAVVEDITERVKTEQQLSLARKVSGLATWNFDVETMSATISEGYNSIYGVPEGTPPPSLDEFIERIHPDDRKSVEATIRRAIVTGTGYSHEYRIVQQSGDVRWLRGIANCTLNAAGAVTNLAGATIDITDNRNAVLVRVPKHFSVMLAYIEDNWSKPLSVELLAEIAGCSSRQIYRYFAAEGLTAATYIKKLRLRHARRLLLNPSQRTTVTEVAIACCFQNPGHFAGHYKAEFAEMPSETLKIGRDSISKPK